jgi:hypothetical protein
MQLGQLIRREFFTLLADAAAWPLGTEFSRMKAC